MGDNGEQLGVMTVPAALDMARKLNLDLVEVAPTAKPPVCRILDYGKFKYEQTKKERQSRRSQKLTALREIRLRPKIGEHDLAFKVRSVKEHLGDGDKVKVTVMFRGREMVHTDIGYKLLQKVAGLAEGAGTIERQAVMEGRRMFIIMAPVAAVKTKPKEVPQDAKAKDS